MPKMIKSGGDGMYSSEVLKGAGFPAAEGWYATTASPDLVQSPETKPFVERFAKKYGQQPENYSITAYDAALVILDAVKRVADSGKTVDRASVRDAIQASHLKTLQGEVSFDENGDITNRIVSVYKIVKDDKFPPDGVDIVAWYVMMGIGQVVILRVPAEKLRDTNRVIEQTAWGGYRTEFYPTYDFKPVWDAIPHHRP